MNRLTRRDFIRNLTAAACVGFGSAASARSSSKVLGSKDDIRPANWSANCRDRSDRPWIHTSFLVSAALDACRIN